MKNGMKISLIEYDAGNLPSVERALARQGVETERVATPDSIAAARVLILPGVGHFGQLMRTLGSRWFARANPRSYFWRRSAIGHLSRIASALRVKR